MAPKSRKLPTVSRSEYTKAKRRIKFTVQPRAESVLMIIPGWYMMPAKPEYGAPGYQSWYALYQVMSSWPAAFNLNSGYQGQWQYWLARHEQDIGGIVT